MSLEVPFLIARERRKGVVILVLIVGALLAGGVVFFGRQDRAAAKEERCLIAIKDHLSAMQIHDMTSSITEAEDAALELIRLARKRRERICEGVK